jgi:hypothetical protein
VHEHNGRAVIVSVSELPVPDSLRVGCLSGYTAGASITRINDFGIVNATFNCIVAFATSPRCCVPEAHLRFASMVRIVELPRSGPVASYSYNVNNRGDVFGYESEHPKAAECSLHWIAGRRT